MAEEVRAARKASLPITMLHENDEARSGCEFGFFFTSTPPDLIEGGLYKALALACYAGSHRAVSMALAARALGATSTGKPSWKPRSGKGKASAKLSVEAGAEAASEHIAARAQKPLSGSLVVVETSRSEGAPTSPNLTSHRV